jgi:hypothetical protein
MALVQSQVGEVLVGDGVAANLRGGRLSDLIVTELRGRYAEATRLGRVFTQVLAATTTGVAAGNINAAAAAAVTQFALWNPAGSGVNVEIVKFFLGVASGTPPAGSSFHSVSQGAPNNSVGAKLTNAFVGGSTSKCLGVASAAGVALTGSPNALITLRPTPFAFIAAAAANPLIAAMEEVNGDIVLPPGTMWVPTWATAGTALLNTYGVVVMETPI